MGEFFGLFGSNGADKTILLKILSGQLPDSGEARTAGLPVTDPVAVKRVVDIVPEAETPPTSF